MIGITALIVERASVANSPSPKVKFRLVAAEKLTPSFTPAIEELAPATVVSPNCTVPVLELDDGNRLVSTLGIWQYLENKHPEPALMGTSALEKGQIADIRWQIEASGFTAVAETLRNSAPAMKGRALPGPP